MNSAICAARDLAQKAVLLVNGRPAVRTRSPAPSSGALRTISAPGAWTGRGPNVLDRFIPSWPPSASGCKMTRTCFPTTLPTPAVEPGLGHAQGRRGRGCRRGQARHRGRAALHRQPAPGRRFRSAEHRRPPRPQRRRRRHVAALRRPRPRGRPARRRLPRETDRQIRHPDRVTLGCRVRGRVDRQRRRGPSLRSAVTLANVSAGPTPAGYGSHAVHPADGARRTGGRTVWGRFRAADPDPVTASPMAISRHPRHGCWDSAGSAVVVAR